MSGKIRPPAIGGGEPMPRDISDLELADVGFVSSVMSLPSLSRCLTAVHLLQRGVPPFQHGFQTGFPAAICKNKKLLQQSGEQIFARFCQVLIEIDHPKDTALLVQRVLFQQFLVKAEPKEHHILIIEVLHHSRANAGVCDVVHKRLQSNFSA